MIYRGTELLFLFFSRLDRAGRSCVGPERTAFDKIDGGRPEVRLTDDACCLLPASRDRRPARCPGGQVAVEAARGRTTHACDHYAQRQLRAFLFQLPTAGINASPRLGR